MDMIQVDTKLFITCRLCLNEFGTYQIVPSVQEQIKFCFDIDVKPFDGLPQLICKKCGEILSDFHMRKKNFQEKHAALLEHVKGRVSHTNIDLEAVLNKLDNKKEVEEAVTSSQINDENIRTNELTNESRRQTNDENTRSNEIPNESRRQINNENIRTNALTNDSWRQINDENIISSKVSNESRRSKAKLRKLRLKHRRSHRSPTWWVKAGFSKQYQCRLCNKAFIIKSSIINHMRCHKTLIENLKKSNIRYCNVRIEKFDGKPNKTGSSKTVVLDDNKVLQNVYNKYYYIKFSANPQTADDNNENESNSDDEISFRGNKKKRRRIVSQDSTDTVILENELVKANDSNKAIVDAECINIDDSSDESESHSKAESEFKEPDYKTIKSIISVCHHKYVNKVVSQENDSQKKNPNVENLLKHKILSIGRKIINKQGFNCNGILRFMDHKNLDIDWKPIMQSEEKKHIRILTEHKSVKKCPGNNRTWTKMNEKVSEMTGSVKIVPDVDETNTNTSFATKNHCKQNDVLGEENNTDISQDSAVLYMDVDNEAKQKILNQNPVDNPKQLPKKIVETKTKNNDQNFIEVSVYDPNYPIVTLEPNNTEGTLLPIITSTTSLAEITVEGDSEKDNQSDASTGTVVQPRIKVKPVSELMAPSPTWSTTNNTNYKSNSVHLPLRVTGSVPQYVIQIHNMPAQQETPKTSQVTNNDNMIMLHTVELPHCKTESPFRYFQNLLQLHSIVLLDCNATITSDFICLVKFKVHYAEGAIYRPIVLCSSLMYLNNYFCIKIWDSNHLEINLTKLSANWQWEILKTFVSDVAHKMLENAMKLGRELYEKASDFIRLLKSIETQKITNTSK